MADIDISHVKEAGEAKLKNVKNTVSSLVASVRTEVEQKQQKVEHTPFAIHHANLVYTYPGEGGLGKEEGEIKKDMTLVVSEEGTIEAIFPTKDTDRVSAIPATYKPLDAEGRYLLPGLINVHTHLFNTGESLPSNTMTKEAQAEQRQKMLSGPGHVALRGMTRRMANELLYSGVTTIRTVGDIAFDTVDLRDDVQDGKVLGPRILASGPMLAGVNGHGAPLLSMECPDKEQALKNIHTLLDNGINAVKIAATGGVTDAKKIGDAGAPQLTEDIMAVIVEEAHKSGISGIIVAAHAQSLEGVKRALRAGVDTIEHGAALDDEALALFHNNPKSLNGYSALTPTLSAIYPETDLDPKELDLSDVARGNAEIVGKTMTEGAQRAVKEKLNILVGTDTAMPYVTQYNTWRELDFLVRYAGMTKAQTLFAATTENAKVLGLAEVTGALKEGLSADLLVVNDNPLEDLRALDKPDLVVANGVPVWHPQATHFPKVDAALDTL